MKPARRSRLPAGIRVPTTLLASAILFLFFPRALEAQSAVAGSDAEIAGRALAQKILAQTPSENLTNTGILEIRNKTVHREELPVTCETGVTPTNWFSRYVAQAGTNESEATTLVVEHAAGQPDRYALSENGHEVRFEGAQAARPFAGSDFWCCDLGLEFFHWPGQKVLKKEFHRQCPCTVLESTNPEATPTGYSRVVSWIDNDSLGIVEAYAYDASGKQLKKFYPKSFEKVNGQYQVQSLVMENTQTGSRSDLDFDLSK